MGSAAHTQTTRTDYDAAPRGGDFVLQSPLMVPLHLPHVQRCSQAVGLSFRNSIGCSQRSHMVEEKPLSEYSSHARTSLSTSLGTSNCFGFSSMAVSLVQ